ncbi:MAG TPA: ATP-binding protein, partial [Candidatus Saccharimonadales bacterium]|nr:ATP-binding protein [Candidatus Saccharimonadales bacterium]
MYRDLVDWGGNLPVWQNELLRRIAKGGDLRDEDVIELAEAAVKESEQQHLPFARLSSADFPTTARVDDGLRLLSVGSLKNVNALRSDQTLNFGHQMTVVYGHNASGKSGYARVLKKVFRARVVDDILPNLRDDPSAIAGKATAALSFAPTPDDVQTVLWTDGEVLPDNCARFAVLDAQCSRTYIANNELAIAPEGLELPARAAKEVDRVQQYLKKYAAQSRPDKAALDAFATQSPSGNFIKSLSPTTSSSDIDQHTMFGENDAKRLDLVVGELASLRHDAPAEARKRIATESANVQSLRGYVSSIEQAIGDDSIA